jgi:ABC-type multidrug transport system fused ATPase/permease subunit
MAKRREPLLAEDKRKLNRQNLRKLAGIFRYILPYKGKFILGMFCLLVSSLSLLSFPFVASKILAAASGRDDWFIQGIDNISLLLLGILVVQALFSFCRVYLFALVSESSMAALRCHLYQKLVYLPMGFYDSQRTGDIMSRITSDVSLLQDTYSTTLAEFVRQIITLSVGTFVIFFFTPKLAGFMLATFPVVIIAGMFFGNFIRKLSRKVQDALATANIIVEETLQAIPMVKAFTSEGFETRRYRQAQDRVVRSAIRAGRFRGAFISFVVIAILGSIVSILWFGAHQVKNGEISTEQLTNFIFYTVFIGGSIAGLGDLFGQIQKAIGASERVLQILATPDEQGREVEKPELTIEGSIAYQSVQFSYPTRPEVEVLRGINITIAPGEKIALVGASGAGKSTIVQLLLRFYQAESGQILVDGKPIKQYNLSAYRANIGIVPQEVILFGGTILENIRYGKHTATEAEVREAARQANALTFIENFPEGFSTLVGERGVKLSGGQRQRIAIARAILKNPKILILDEATSSLDAESERLVQDALTTLMQNRTTIIIAHRLVTVRQADRIYVLEAGQISEQGTHDELLRNSGGKYSKLVRLQLQKA